MELSNPNVDAQGEGAEPWAWSSPLSGHLCETENVFKLKKKKTHKTISKPWLCVSAQHHNPGASLSPPAAREERLLQTPLEMGAGK